MQHILLKALIRDCKKNKISLDVAMDLAFDCGRIIGIQEAKLIVEDTLK